MYSIDALCCRAFIFHGSQIILILERLFGIVSLFQQLLPGRAVLFLPCLMRNVSGGAGGGLYRWD